MAQSFIGRSGLPLGLINNNPGNIKASSRYEWEGQIGVNRTFVVFDDIAWGIRAFIKNMYSSITRSNTDTLRKYISRYAPENENDTNAYINYVVSQTGIDADSPIPTDIESIKKIMIAQFKMENGPDKAALITDDDINEAISRLDSPVASFFKASQVFYKANKNKVNVAVIVAVVVGLAGYIYYLKRKKI